MNMDFDTMRDTMTAAAEPEDYTGADGLLYCGKCRKPKESYFSEDKTLFGRDRHPAECDCQRKIREERQAAEEHRRHLDVERFFIKDRDQKKKSDSKNRWMGSMMRVCCDLLHALFSLQTGL